MFVPWLLAPGATFKLYLLTVLIASPICFALYAIDKRRAIQQRPRISERTLQVAAFVGGWPGAWAAQRLFRHKTKKLTFRVLFWAIVSLHLGFIFICLMGMIAR